MYLIFILEYSKQAKKSKRKSKESKRKQDKKLEKGAEQSFNNETLDEKSESTEIIVSTKPNEANKISTNETIEFNPNDIETMLPEIPEGTLSEEALGYTKKDREAIVEGWNKLNEDCWTLLKDQDGVQLYRDQNQQ